MWRLIVSLSCVAAGRQQRTQGNGIP